MNPILLTITQNDYGFNWNFTLTDGQNNPVNLTGAELFFSFQLQSDPAVEFSNAMTIVNPTSGTCQYLVGQNDFIVAGTYAALIKVAYPGGETVSFSGITVQVNPLIPIN